MWPAASDGVEVAAVGAGDPADDRADLELEVEALGLRRTHLGAGRDDRVRVREVERRELVPLVDHVAGAVDRRGDALDVLLEGDEVAHARRHERGEQLDLGERHRSPRHRPRLRVAGSVGEPGREHVGDRQAVAGTRTTPSPTTNPSPTTPSCRQRAILTEARSDACRERGQQLGRVARQDRALVGLREPGLAHALDRVVDAHVERVVGAEQHPVGADRLDERTQRARGVHERVEPQASQVRRRQLAASVRLGPHLPRVVGATEERGQVAAAVRGDDPQVRMPVEHAREDEVRQRDRVLDRLADRVREVVAVEPLVEAAAERVQEHDRVELLGARPERLEPLVRELDVARERRELDAREPVLDHGVLERVDDELRMLQRHEPEAEQPVGRARDVLGDGAVRLARGPRRRAPRPPTGSSATATATRPARRRPAGPSRRGARRAT